MVRLGHMNIWIKTKYFLDIKMLFYILIKHFSCWWSHKSLAVYPTELCRLRQCCGGVSSYVSSKPLIPSKPKISYCQRTTFWYPNDNSITCIIFLSFIICMVNNLFSSTGALSNKVWRALKYPYWWKIQRIKYLSQTFKSENKAVDVMQNCFNSERDHDYLFCLSLIQDHDCMCFSLNSIKYRNKLYTVYFTGS